MKRKRKISPEGALVLAEKYRAGASLKELASEVGVTAMTARKALLDVGATMRPRGGTARNWTPEQQAVVVRMRREGMSQRVIARELGVHVGRVQAMLYDAGMSPKKILLSRVKASDGYMAVRVDPDDPMYGMTGSNGYIKEHRLVMARALGRPLDSWETVHHIDGNRSNNDLANLQLRQGKHGPGSAWLCHDCGSHNVRPVQIADYVD